MEIVGFNHDDLTNGGKAPYTFGMKNLMGNVRQMNSSATNAGSLTGSDMYTWLSTDLYNALPADLRAVMKNINKQTGKGDGDAWNSRIEAMSIFLFSEREITGQNAYSVPAEGVQYTRFSSTNSRIKKLLNGSGNATNWWLRSPDGSVLPESKTNFCFVNSSGVTDAAGANQKYGVCFGFCV